jgi:hypothetical protein
MIIAIRTKQSDVLDRFASNFLEPKTPFKQLTHAYAYTTKRVTKIDDLIIFEFESIVDVISRKGIILGACSLFVGYIFQYSIVAGLGLFFTLLPALILSKSIRQLMFLAELKRGGHKDKIRFLSTGELNKLLLSKVV